MIDALSRYANGVRTAYGVDPRVFIALFVVSIPPFYVALAVAARRFADLRVQGKPVLSVASRDRKFAISAAIMGVSWALPYAYVALFGRGLPWWTWTILAVLVVTGAASAVRSARRRAAGDSREKEHPDE